MDGIWSCLSILNLDIMYFRKIGNVNASEIKLKRNYYIEPRLISLVDFLTFEHDDVSINDTVEIQRYCTHEEHIVRQISFLCRDLHHVHL